MRSFLLIGLFLCATSALLADALPAVPGRATMFIKYRSPVGNRAKFIEQAARTIVPRFEQWKREGVLADSALYYNIHLDRDTWDVLAVVELDNVRQLQRWYEIERQFPGGLTTDELSLGSPFSTEFADRTWSGTRPPRKPADAYYYIIQYDYFEPAAYRAYCEVFLERQVKLWMEKGMLTNYNIWLNQAPRMRPNEEPSMAGFPMGSSWDSIMIWEYRDLEAFALRDITKWETRTGVLQSDAAFTAVAQIPRVYRIEYNICIARAILPAPAK